MLRVAGWQMSKNQHHGIRCKENRYESTLRFYSYLLPVCVLIFIVLTAFLPWVNEGSLNVIVGHFFFQGG